MFQCIICHDNFTDSAENPVAALACGHIFHHACVHQWIEHRPKCPLCQHKVARNKMISRLFFSVAENTDVSPTTTTADTSQLELDNRELRHKELILQQENNKLKGDVSEITHKQLSTMSQLQQALLENQVLHNKNRFLCQLEKVANLDDLMDSESSRRYSEDLMDLSVEELRVHILALRARQVKASSERDRLQKAYERQSKSLKKIEDENTRLRNKSHRYKDIIANNHLPLQPIQQETRKKAPVKTNVIDLDTEDSDEEPKPPQAAQIPDFINRKRELDLEGALEDSPTFGEDLIEIQDYDPNVLFSRPKRRQQSYASTLLGSSKRSKGSSNAIDLSQDDI